MKAPQYGRSPVQDATEALDAIDRINGSTWNDSPSRARAFSTDRRASLQLAEAINAPCVHCGHPASSAACHCPASGECVRCGSPVTFPGEWCLQCRKDKAEWDRIEQAVAGKRPKEAEYTWRGLAVACALWAAFVLVGCYVLVRVVQP